jgi:hypothetical protein
MPSSKKSLFASVFPTKPWHALPFSSMCASCPVHLILLYLITLITFCQAQIITLHIMQFSPLAYHFLPLRVNIFSQPYSQTFHILTLVSAPRFTSIQSNRQNYSYVYFSIYIFGQETGQKVLKWTVIYISQIYSALLFMQRSCPIGKKHDNTSSLTTSFHILCNLLRSDHTLFNLLFTNHPIIGCIITTNAFQCGIKYTESK